TPEIDLESLFPTTEVTDCQCGFHGNLRGQGLLTRRSLAGKGLALTPRGGLRRAGDGKAGHVYETIRRAAVQGKSVRRVASRKDDHSGGRWVRPFRACRRPVYIVVTIGPKGCFV